jgi:hypothetical protein
MNDTVRRTWPAIGVAVLALCYLWIGATAHGWDRVLGLAGGTLILAAVAVAAAHRCESAAYPLLLTGALPLAIVTWWSIATPVLAIVVLLLGRPLRSRTGRRAVAGRRSSGRGPRWRPGILSPPPRSSGPSGRRH